MPRATRASTLSKPSPVTYVCSVKPGGRRISACAGVASTAKTSVTSARSGLLIARHATRVGGAALAVTDDGSFALRRTDMRFARLTLCALLVALAAAPGVARAALGEYHTITGQITMWGPSRFDQQVGIVRDDEGQSWVVRFGPGTLPDGAAVGTEIMVMARETALPSELEAVAASLTASVSALPAGAASGWAVVPGAVQDASGVTAVIRSNGGMGITVHTDRKRLV